MSPRVSLSFLDHLTPTTLAAIAFDLENTTPDVARPADRDGGARVLLAHVNDALDALVGPDEAAELKAAIAAHN